VSLSTERHSARLSKIKNGGLDQRGVGPFEQQQFGTAGVERVKMDSPAYHNNIIQLELWKTAELVFFKKDAMIIHI